MFFYFCFFILQIVKYIAESVSGSALIDMRAAKNYEMQYRLVISLHPVFTYASVVMRR